MPQNRQTESCKLNSDAAAVAGSAVDAGRGSDQGRASFPTKQTALSSALSVRSLALRLSGKAPFFWMLLLHIRFRLLQQMLLMLLLQLMLLLLLLCCCYALGKNVIEKEIEEDVSVFYLN